MIQRHYLGLDQSPRKIGFAIGAPDMISPISGVFELPSMGADFGFTLATVRDWLSNTLKTYHVSNVCFETPFSAPRVSTATRQMFSLADFIQFVCVDQNVRCREATAAAWRKHFMGVTQAPKEIRNDAKRRAWIKEQSIRACTLRHWFVRSDDEADACGILDWALSCDHPTYAAKSSFISLLGE